MSIIYIDKIVDGFDIGYTSRSHEQRRKQKKRYTGESFTFEINTPSSSYSRVVNDHQIRDAVNRVFGNPVMGSRETYQTDMPFSDAKQRLAHILKTEQHRKLRENVIDGHKLIRLCETLGKTIDVYTLVLGQVCQVHPYMTQHHKVAMQRLDGQEPKIKMFNSSDGVYQEGTNNYLNKSLDESFVFSDRNLSDFEIQWLLKDGYIDLHDSHSLSRFFQ